MLPDLDLLQYRVLLGNYTLQDDLGSLDRRDVGEGAISRTRLRELSRDGLEYVIVADLERIEAREGQLGHVRESGEHDILSVHPLSGLDFHLEDDLEEQADHRVHEELVELDIGARLQDLATLTGLDRRREVDGLGLADIDPGVVQVDVQSSLGDADREISVIHLSLEAGPHHPQERLFVAVQIVHPHSDQVQLAALFRIEVHLREAADCQHDLRVLVSLGSGQMLERTVDARHAVVVAE